jgi:hypothetical protein
MLVFPAIGLLLWIAFLFVVMVLAGVVWALSRLALGIASFIQRPNQWQGAGLLRTPPQVQRRLPYQAQPQALSPTRETSHLRDRTPRPLPAPAQAEIWPKWTPAHRRYVDEELALWQQQFDALSSRQ